ncbi:MAG: hypothetical protein R3A11_08345 [Bdellovibrionota bacterium]
MGKNVAWILMVIPFLFSSGAKAEHLCDELTLFYPNLSKSFLIQHPTNSFTSTIEESIDNMKNAIFHMAQDRDALSIQACIKAQYSGSEKSLWESYRYIELFKEYVGRESFDIVDHTFVPLPQKLPWKKRLPKGTFRITLLLFIEE